MAKPRAGWFSLPRNRHEGFHGVAMYEELEIQKLEAASALLGRVHASVGFTMITKMIKTTALMMTVTHREKRSCQAQ